MSRRLGVWALVAVVVTFPAVVAVFVTVHFLVRLAFGDGPAFAVTLVVTLVAGSAVQVAAARMLTRQLLPPRPSRRGMN